MAYSKSIASFIQDQLSELGELRTKKMFGALAIYCDDILFAAVMDESFTLKAKDDTLQAEFIELGMTRHTIKGRDIKMPYFDVPAALLEDRDALKTLALKSITTQKK